MATNTQDLSRETWRLYFDELSKTIGTVEATVEVAGKDLGAQVAAEQLILTGLTYDDGDDIFVIGLDARGGPPEDFEHIVYNPRRIMVTGGRGVELVIAIEDADQRQTLVRIERPPALPAE